mgnify:FL=1
MSEQLDPQFIEEQKQKLLQHKNEILNSMRNHSDEELKADKDEVVEDGDQAQKYLDQNLSFGLRQREVQRLREIDAALERIENGSYGICEETDEPISKKRLEKMPWTRLSIEAAEELEREQSGFRQAG